MFDTCVTKNIVLYLPKPYVNNSRVLPLLVMYEFKPFKTTVQLRAKRSLKWYFLNLKYELELLFKVSLKRSVIKKCSLVVFQ